MTKRKRRTFTAAFKADAVRLCTSGGKTIAEVTKQFYLTETSLRGWVKQAEIDAGKGGEGALTTAAPARVFLDIDFVCAKQHRLDLGGETLDASALRCTNRNSFTVVKWGCSPPDRTRNATSSYVARSILRDEKIPTQ